MSDNPFKKLAGQTVVYGLGTILARLLNYLLVPLYVRVFAPEIYGQFTELYAYIALFMALLTYGMETTFFRRAQGDNFSKVYGNIMTSILTTTGVFVAAVICLYPFVSDLINYDGREIYLLFTGLIVAVDAITAVPFCVLRKNEKPGRFSLIKLSNVCINVAVVLFCLFVIPDTCTLLSNQWFGPEAGLLTWVFISNLVASLCNVLMLLPEFKQIKLQFDWTLMKKLLGYALPVMLINLIGMVNEVVDKIVIKYMVADKATAMTQLGIYGANYKLAVLMTIFVQMFRFASEPFFFNKAKDRNSPQLFADVMKYFVICGLLIFLGVTLYLDLFGYFLGGHDGYAIPRRPGDSARRTDCQPVLRHNIQPLHLVQAEQTNDLRNHHHRHRRRSDAGVSLRAGTRYRLLGCRYRTPGLLHGDDDGVLPVGPELPAQAATAGATQDGRHAAGDPHPLRHRPHTDVPRCSSGNICPQRACPSRQQRPDVHAQHLLPAGLRRLRFPDGEKKKIK